MDDGFVPLRHKNALLRMNGSVECVLASGVSKRGSASPRVPVSGSRNRPKTFFFSTWGMGGVILMDQ